MGPSATGPVSFKLLLLPLSPRLTQLLVLAPPVLLVRLFWQSVLLQVLPLEPPFMQSAQAQLLLLELISLPQLPLLPLLLLVPWELSRALRATLLPLPPPLLLRPEVMVRLERSLLSLLLQLTGALKGTGSFDECRV